MIAVSDRWKELQKGQLVPLSEIEIEYNITEPGVQTDASSTATYEETFSAAESVVVEVLSDEPKYAMLEHNQWVLDGTHIPLPTNVPDAHGFVSSNLSNADGAFTAIPTITIRFSETHEAVLPGLTLTWSKTYQECQASCCALPRM